MLSAICKTVTTSVALAVFLPAVAQPAGAPKAIIAPGVNAPAYKLQAPKGAAWPRALQGVWVSEADPAQGTLAGSLTLGKDAALALKPEAMYELRGFWYVVQNTLVFDTPVQKVSMAYVLQGQTLTIDYGNGLKQVFKRGSS